MAGDMTSLALTAVGGAAGGGAITGFIVKLAINRTLKQLDTAVSELTRIAKQQERHEVHISNLLAADNQNRQTAENLAVCRAQFDDFKVKIGNDLRAAFDKIRQIERDDETDTSAMNELARRLTSLEARMEYQSSKVVRNE